MNKGADIIVVGAGLHGACSAMYLAGRGLKVILLDKGVGGRNSSASNAGGVRRLMRDVRELPLADAAAHMWHNIEKIVDDDCGYQTSGQIYLAETKQDMEKLNARKQLMDRLGYLHEELIDQSELKRMIPVLNNNCIGALVAREDGFASPFRTTTAFQRKAEANGVVFKTNHPVTAIEKVGGIWNVKTPQATFEAPIILNTSGAWGDKIAAMVGDNVPVSPEAPTMMVTAPVKKFLKPVVCHISRKLSFKQAPNGAVLIGGGYRGTLDRDKGYTKVDFAGLKLSAETVMEFFPLMKNVPIVRCWSGIEGLTPDRIPAIGPGLAETGVYHAFAFSSHGFQLAPIVGKMMCELIVDGQSSISLEAFSLTRFNALNFEAA